MNTSTTFKFKTELNQNAEITVDNNFQDITFKIEREMNSSFCCTPGALLKILENNFTCEDQIKIIKMIIGVANDEMTYKALFIS